MRKEPNKVLRAVVPLAILIVLGGSIVAAFVLGGKAGQGAGQTTGAGTSDEQAAATAPLTSTPSGTAAPTAEPRGTEAPPPAQSPTTAQTPAAEQPAEAAPPLSPTTDLFAGLRATEINRVDLTPIGSITSARDGGKYSMRLEFSAIGAGVERLTLANHFEHADRRTNEVLQQFARSYLRPELGIVPYAAEAVTINGQRVVLSVNTADTSRTFWREVAPGEFEATIENGSATPVAVVTRRYELPEDSYEFVVRQRVRNLTDAPIEVRFEQFGPADPPLGVIRYGGDSRRLRFGYLLPLNRDPARITQSDEFLITHYDLLSGHRPNPSRPDLPFWESKKVWPNDTSQKEGLDLVWAAMTNRYFAVSVQSPVSDAAASGESKRLDSVETIERFVVPNGRPATISFVESIFNFVVGHQRLPAGEVALKFTSTTQRVAGGGFADFSIAAYAGPMAKSVIGAQPISSAVGLREVVVYNFGGPCAFCTFQTLTHLLLAFLTTIQRYVVFDWALAIMLLVVCVRTILHPVTRWSQVNLLRFGKQMQAIAPKQRALQEKYGKDPKKLREEMARLMREENVNYAGALGCLPMFLQTPIWIALSAMLFFAFELRHEPAFFGIIQTLTGGGWLFLADLAEPDKFLDFRSLFGMQKGIPLPLLSGFIGPVDSLNILPLLMGVLFYIQQKYMQPPTTVTLTPEQQQQQKIAKVMMVVLFPLFMYNAPSGLALYFLTNSALGIFESRWIRAHVDKSELEPKKPTTGKKRSGWLARMQERAIEIQKQREQQARLAQKYKKK
ncbi:MAG: YidC/Oxa1 family insertase periplasmic-domain containing protein [Phycisphaeraceae bacterium]|nr:YidC/Oxa1 family insertase periplasmic-domain containing protein [Phycisphaeraceae bacterium]